MKMPDLSKMSKEQREAHFKEIRRKTVCYFEHFTRYRDSSIHDKANAVVVNEFLEKLNKQVPLAKEFRRDFVTVCYDSQNERLLLRTLRPFKVARDTFVLKSKMGNFRIRLKRTKGIRKQNKWYLTSEDKARLDEVIARLNYY